MPVKIKGLNFDLNDGYYAIFNKTAMHIAGDQWVYSVAGDFVGVATSDIQGGLHGALDYDRELGLIHRIASIHMSPEFALLMLQQEALKPEMFDGADEGDGWIGLAPSQYQDIFVGVMIIEDLPVAMRTVDAHGISL